MRTLVVWLKVAQKSVRVVTVVTYVCESFLSIRSSQKMKEEKRKEKRKERKEKRKEKREKRKEKREEREREKREKRKEKREKKRKEKREKRKKRKKRKKKKRKDRTRRQNQVPSHAQELFAVRVRGNSSPDGFLDESHRAILTKWCVPLSYVCPHCRRFPLEDYRVWVTQGSRDHREANSFSGSCGTTGNLGQLDQRADAPDKPAERWRQHSWKHYLKVERSRSRIMDGLRKFIAVDNHAAVKVGDLPRERRPKKVVRPRFATEFSGAVTREGAQEEGVLRTFIDSPKVEEEKMEASASRRGLARLLPGHFQGVEGPEWEAMHHYCKDLHQAVKRKKSGENKEGEVLWATRLNFWAIHIKSPTAALAKVMECLEQGEGVPSATSEW